MLKLETKETRKRTPEKIIWFRLFCAIVAIAICCMPTEVAMAKVADTDVRKEDSEQDEEPVIIETITGSAVNSVFRATATQKVIAEEDVISSHLLSNQDNKIFPIVTATSETITDEAITEKPSKGLAGIATVIDPLTTATPSAIEVELPEMAIPSSNVVTNSAVTGSAVTLENVTSSAVTGGAVTNSAVTSKEKKQKRRERRKKELQKLKNFYQTVNIYDTDMSKNLGISKKRFVKILEVLPYDYANVFEDNAEFLWETAKKYDFNEFLMIGIMAQESQWGKSPVNTNNFSSQRISGNVWYSYDTPEEGIEALAKNLANNYLPTNGKYYHGKSLRGIGTLYCEGNTWAGAVCTCTKMVLREYFKTI